MFTRYRLLAAVAALIAAAFLIAPAGAQPAPQTVFGDTVPARPADPETAKVEVGTRFTVAKDGLVTAIRFYKGDGNTGTHVGKLYAGNREVARVTFTNETGTGWQVAQLTAPVAVKPGTTYTASYVALNGKYASDERYAWPKKSGDLTATGGFYRYPEGYPTQQWNRSNYYVDVLFTTNAPAPTTTPPTTTTQAPPTTTTAPPSTSTAPPTTTVPPTTTPQPAGCEGDQHTPGGPDGKGGCWPGLHNTGVPAGVTLAPYTGPQTITQPNTVIDGKTYGDALVIKAPGVVIKNSRIGGFIDLDAPASLTIEDSEIDGGQFPGPAVGYQNLTVRRSEITGAWGNFSCSFNCVIENSYLHKQYLPQNIDVHSNAFISNGNGDGPIVLRHNTLHCDVQVNPVDGGCSTEMSLYPDFAPIKNVTVDNNLFPASLSAGYCASFGWNPGKTHNDDPTNATGIKVTGNVFQRGANGKCGLFGAVTSFVEGRPGNVWADNKWDDGAVLTP